MFEILKPRQQNSSSLRLSVEIRAPDGSQSRFCLGYMASCEPRAGAHLTNLISCRL